MASVFLTTRNDRCISYIAFLVCSSFNISQWRFRYSPNEPNPRRPIIPSRHRGIELKQADSKVCRNILRTPSGNILSALVASLFPYRHEFIASSLLGKTQIKHSESFSNISSCRKAGTKSVYIFCPGHSLLRNGVSARTEPAPDPAKLNLNPLRLNNRRTNHRPPISAS